MDFGLKVRRKAEENFMRRLLVFVFIIMCAAVTVSAQSENDLKRHAEGKQVTLKMEVPATEDVVRQISYEYTAPGSRKIGVVRVGSPTTYLKRGLTTEEVLQVLGQPAGISKRVEAGRVVTTYEFRRGGERMLVAEFVNNTLVYYRTETREQVAQANR